MAENNLLTDLERKGMKQTADLWNTLCEITGVGVGRAGDLRELQGHIHGIQRAIMAQAACRAYPDSYRLLGADPVRTLPDGS